MLGTFVNIAAVLAGGALGLLLKGGIKDNYRTMLNYSLALTVLFIGFSGALSNMLQPDANPLLFAVSLAIGGLVGEWMGIERALERLGSFLQTKLSTGGDSTFSKGFVASSLLYCVGTMAILGSLQSATEGTHTILFAKSLLDGVMSIAMASALGVGVLFSAFSVFVYQGSITLLAQWISPFLTADMLRELSIVGGIILVAISLNMLELTKIKTGNLLPAILVPIVYYLVLGFFT